LFLGLIAAQMAQAYVKPFVNEEMNNVEAVSIFVTTIIYFCGYFTFASFDLNHIMSESFTVVAFAVNLGFLLYSFKMFYNMKQQAIENTSTTVKNFGWSLVEILKSQRQHPEPKIGDKHRRKHSEKIELQSKEEKNSGAFEGMDFVDFINEFPAGPRVNAFKAFLKSEFSDENVDFYVECYEFRIRAGHDPNAPPLALWEKAGKPPPLSDELKPVLNAICDQHVRDGSPRQVNLPARLQKAVLTAVDSDVITTVVLDDAFHEIIKLMGRDSFPRFMETEHWRNLLTHTEV
jgi:hypothetical protein